MGRACGPSLRSYNFLRCAQHAPAGITDDATLHINYAEADT